MDRKLKKKRERTKRINKLRNMVQNNASDQDRLDINPNSYKLLGHDDDGDQIILKKTLEKDSYEAIYTKDAVHKVVDAAKLDRQEEKEKRFELRKA